ncbi:NAD-dependent protein deacylase sirtuin-5, mitochondrial [Polyplax serrata]|uniref:NAD-dependent protein deacylase n=1 Tax=Polyplax serrata TaxID=468196 RepID=A0AAN8NUS2_POLSC
MACHNRPSSDMSKFREIIKKSKSLLILTGAGVSAESGIPTFRGPGGYWRKYRAENLATPEAFYSNPSLVWEFYHHRREVALTKEPNKAHVAIAQCQDRFSKEGKKVWIITQNIDELHKRAGARDVLELHGSLFKTKCLKCGEVAENYDSPICSALAGKGAPDPGSESADIPDEQLPRCKKETCKGLLRPHIVWFGENLDRQVLDLTEKAVDECDVCMVVGTSSVVYPAAMFAPQVARRGAPVAEFNLETTPATHDFQFHFDGPCGLTIPAALDP